MTDKQKSAPQRNMLGETAASIFKVEAAARTPDVSASKFETHTPCLPIANLGGERTLANQEDGGFQNPANFAQKSQETAPQDHTLGRFGHHPDPANDFCIEVEAIQGQLFDATHGISKPGTEPVSLEAVCERIDKAMEFRVGADEIAVAAKQTLRGLAEEATRFQPNDADDIERLKQRIADLTTERDSLAAIVSSGIDEVAGAALDDAEETIRRLTANPAPQTNVRMLFEAYDRLHRKSAQDLSGLVGDFKSSTVNSAAGGNQLANYLASGANGLFIGKFVGEKFGPVAVLFENTCGSDVIEIPGHASSLQLPAHNLAELIVFPSHQQSLPQTNTTAEIRWIEWKGGDFLPVPPEMRVTALLRDGSIEGPAPAREFGGDESCWKHRGAAGDIVAYTSDLLFAAPPENHTQAIGTALADALSERQRQLDAEGWIPQHDDQYRDNELIRAATCYLLGNAGNWPWSRNWWKPTDRRRDLIKASALIIAEIERMDRAALAITKDQP